jgi:hypothetical protein
LRRTALSAARFSILVCLRYDGDATIGQLAAAERVAQPSMTQLAAALERGGLVLRRSDPADGDAVLWHSHPPGAHWCAARPARSPGSDSAIAGLGASQLGALHEAAAVIDAQALRDSAGDT